MLINITITSKLFIKQNAFENGENVMPDLTAQIADEEAEAMNAAKKRTPLSQTGGSEPAIDDDDDYDNLVAKIVNSSQFCYNKPINMHYIFLDCRVGSKLLTEDF